MNEKKSTIAEHYDELYSKEVPFGMKADLVIHDIPNPMSGNALELGAGQGRNSFVLAGRGLTVSAIDVSPKAVESVNKHATKESIAVQASVGDIANLEWQREYDVIVSTFVLHHLSREDGLRVIREIKEHTKPGGFNALALFTQDGDFYRLDKEKMNYYPAIGELRDFYSDWDVISYSEAEGTAHARNEDGSPMKNIVARILARKVK